MATNRNCTFTVTIQQQPYCPGCGSALTDDGWRCVAGIAMCDACRGSVDGGLLNLISSVTTHPVGSILTRRQGICFYTPTLDGPPGRPPTLYNAPPYLDHPRTVRLLQDRAAGRDWHPEPGSPATR